MRQQQLFQMMAQGAVIITPNQRLSRHLLHDFYHAHHVREKPLCVAYLVFLKHLFHRIRHLQPHSAHPVLLTAAQQRALWRHVITSSTQAHVSRGVLDAVEQAWSRCQYWEIDMLDESFDVTPTTQNYQMWQENFQHELMQRHAITEEQLATYLLNYPEIFQYQHVVWACFDEDTPQQLHVKSMIQAQGGCNIVYDLGEKNTSVHQYAADNTQDETAQMIRWLQAKLQAGEKRIAVVVPDLQTEATTLQRQLEQHFTKDQFNISLGRPLNTYPLIAHALLWLSLDKTTLSQHQMRLLLHSPFLQGSQSENMLRAQLMQDAPYMQENNIPFASFMELIKQDAPLLSACLENLPEYPASATPALWMMHFKTRLKTLGFPGEYPLNSMSFQCFQRFMTLFDEVMQYAFIHPIMNQKQALDAVDELTSLTLFQTRTSTTPIQILGLLEVSGCTFDSLWMSGLTDQCLPQKTRFSPFLPLNIQRDHNMPYSSSARELQLSQQCLLRLQRACEDVVFSYPRFVGDLPQLPSSLITDYPPLATLTASMELQPSALIAYEEHYLLPMLAQEKIKGGTSLLAHQASCPFKAFAAHRLHAKNAPEVSFGPSSSERGQSIHRVLELFWQKITSQAHLNLMSAESLEKHIDQSIQQALQPLAQQRTASFTPLIQDVEHQRLKTLVYADIAWEQTRPPFRIVSLEQTFTLTLEKLDLRVRLDRLDATDDGAQCVIDYKTSIPANKPWDDERLEHPQLPLYACLDEAINTVLFLQLKKDHVTCHGISAHAHDVEGLKSLDDQEAWRDYKHQWHNQLTVLAHELNLGLCEPKPYLKSTCASCEFQSLCRFQGDNA